MTYLAWLQLVLIIAVAGVFAGALVSALASKLLLDRLRTVAPKTRFALWSSVAFLPIALGAVAVTIGFAPSVLDALGLATDHCADHAGHAFHLCFVHGHPPELATPVLVVGLFLFVWLAVSFQHEIARLRRANSWKRSLSHLARYDHEIDGWRVATGRPFAACAGFFNPRIFVSDGLLDILSAQQFRAVLAHEREHVARRDSLTKIIVRVGALFHVPVVRKRILEEIELACEQSCDEAAAVAIGDRLTVAGAILAVERALGNYDIPLAALGFGDHALDSRVRSMVDEDWRHPAWPVIATACSAVVGAMICSYELLHHAVESLLLQVF